MEDLEEAVQKELKHLKRTDAITSAAYSMVRIDYSPTLDGPGWLFAVGELRHAGFDARVMDREVGIVVRGRLKEGAR